LQGEVPVRVAAGDSLRMTSRLQVVLVRLARRTKIGDVVFDKGEVVTAHLDGPVVTITSPSRVATANRYSLPRPRRLREKELARCGASGISPAILVALSGLGSIRGAKSLRRGSLLEVTDVAGGVVSLRAQELEIVLACRALCGAVEHAYAFSVATAQSQTIGSTWRAGHAVVVSADEMGREEALVALTRARDGTTLWACVEDQATATWTRKRTEAAEALAGAIDRLGHGDPQTAAFLSLVTGADANPLDARTAGAALGLDADETGKLARRATAALRSPGIGEVLAIPGSSRAETSARDIVAAARRVFAERVQDPVVRMAQRWGTGATREHAASTEMRRRAEAQQFSRAMHGQDEAARVAVSAFVHAAGSADVAARPAPDDAGGQDHAGHHVSPTSDSAFTAVVVSDAAAAAELASRRPMPSARAGAGRPSPVAMAGARDGRKKRPGSAVAHEDVRSQAERHELRTGHRDLPAAPVSDHAADDRRAGDAPSVAAAGDSGAGSPTPPGRHVELSVEAADMASTHVEDAGTGAARRTSGDGAHGSDLDAAGISSTLVGALRALSAAAARLSRHRPAEMAVREAFRRLAAAYPDVAAEVDGALGGREAAIGELVRGPRRPSLSAADRQVLARLSRMTARLAKTYGETEAVMLVVSFAAGDGAPGCSSALRSLGGPAHLALALIAARTAGSGQSPSSGFAPAVATTMGADRSSGMVMGS
ncbi:MAG: hypothetical protein M0020_05135, partial [Actinomycetota bacterium]|nr:hypothetical protein [Actinomycetota bacterium]